MLVLLHLFVLRSEDSHIPTLLASTIVPCNGGQKGWHDGRKDEPLAPKDSIHRKDPNMV